ncbi:Rrf2 family transcriptional regulator, partial [bacterium]|nr:Rrf2 family transcriptional regulator [bacterium]
MRLSTKGRYGIRAMVVLAARYREGPISVRYISEKEDLSIDYIEQLFIKLRKRGLIKSIRGPGGGFLLARPPAKVRIGDIIRSIEEPIALVPCIEDGEKCSTCPRYKGCTIRKLWERMGNRIIGILDSTTLKDL